jgi:type VI secretion system secreted protein Hcp
MKTTLKLLLAGMVAFAGLTVGASATIEIFLQVDGIDGESQDSAHPNTIELLTVSTNVFQQGLNLAGTGAGAAKTQFNPITVAKQVDKTSPALFVACATGKHIKTATIFIRNSQTAGTPVDFFKIILTDVLVSSITSDAERDSDYISEKVTLSFSKIEWDFTPVNGDGLPQTPVKGGFDVKLNRALTLSSGAQ